MVTLPTSASAIQLEAIATAKAKEALIQSLTPSEIAVLKSTAAGRTGKQTAAQLGNSEKTIKGHKTNIYKKLKVKNIVQAVLMFEAEVGSTEYVGEISRLKNQVQLLRDEVEVERAKADKIQKELEKIQRGKRSEFKILPSSSVKAFNSKYNGVPK